MTTRILVIEDSPDIALLVQLHLAELPATVEVETDGETGLQRARAGVYDALLLDVSLPGLDGFGVLEQLRAASITTPVLLMSGRIAEIPERIAALPAVDLIAKPFGVATLVERVRALLSKHAVAPATPDLVDGSLHIAFRERFVEREGRRISLSEQEFDLLALLARVPGRIFTRREILAAIWHEEDDERAYVVNAHLARLRARVEPNPERPRWLCSVPGGYVFTCSMQKQSDDS